MPTGRPVNQGNRMKINIDPAVGAIPLTALYRTLGATLRLRLVGEERLFDVWKSGRLTVLSCWHNELFAFPLLKKLAPADWIGIVSASKDGEWLAQVIKRLGVETARGSSSRGGVRALMGAVREMKRRRLQGFVTVDGPRGPRHEPKDGVFLMAQKADALVVPVRCRFSRRYVFEKAWDRFELPYPFSTCTFLFGEPYEVSREKFTRETLDTEKRRLKEKMDALG